MKFLVDAQLPARLARFLQNAGHDAVHTSALSTGNHTTDTRITEIADEERRVVVTKDRDFRDGHLLYGSPRRLLVVATGNTTNTELLALFESNPRSDHRRAGRSRLRRARIPRAGHP